MRNNNAHLEKICLDCMDIGIRDKRYVCGNCVIELMRKINRENKEKLITKWQRKEVIQ